MIATPPVLLSGLPKWWVFYHLFFFVGQIFLNKIDIFRKFEGLSGEILESAQLSLCLLIIFWHFQKIPVQKSCPRFCKVKVCAIKFNTIWWNLQFGFKIVYPNTYRVSCKAPTTCIFLVTKIFFIEFKIFQLI